MGIKGQKGVSLVEFAIVLPLLVILIFGIIEFGIILYDKAIITNACREGARAGILARYDPTTKTYTPLPTTCGTSCDSVENTVNNYCAPLLITFGSGTVATTSTPADGSLTTGVDRVVTVSYIYTFLVLPNFVSHLTGGITLTSTATMRME